MVSQPQNSAPPCDTVSQLSQESLPEALSSFFLQDPDPQAGVWLRVRLGCGMRFGTSLP